MDSDEGEPPILIDECDTEDEDGPPDLIDPDVEPEEDDGWHWKPPKDRWHWEHRDSRQRQHVPVQVQGAVPQSQSSSSSTRSRGRILYLFSGPSGRKDGLAAYLAGMGFQVDECDVINEHLGDQDLLDDTVWLRIKARMRDGYYVALFASPPCRSFSAARSSGPGPPVLRDAHYIYGFPKSQRWRKLEHSHYERIREDNLFAERTAEACSVMDSLGRPFGVEQPEPWGAAVTMFGFDSFKKLLSDGAQMVAFDQCPFGAPCKKPSLVLYKGADFQVLECRCDHPAVQQWDANGSVYWAPHPSFVSSGGRGRKDSKGNFATNALSAYPAKLNRKLAFIISRSIAEPGHS